jgi:hypothetical protein
MPADRDLLISAYDAFNARLIQPLVQQHKTFPPTAANDHRPGGSIGGALLKPL